MRTKHTLYNFIVSVIASVLLPLVGFIKVRLFVDLYGSGVNGLQLTIAQIITFLNICELAFSLAFRQLLFKPLAEDDRKTVKKIYYGARKVFKITGTVVIGVSLIVALIFPFFAKSPYDYASTVGLFFLTAIPYGVSYYLMGPNFVIIADQKEYKINFWIQLFSILRMVLMIIVILLKWPFVWVVIIESANVLISNIVARNIALKYYPWLKEKCDDSDKSFLHNTKYTIVQRLSYLASTNTDNIVITAFMGYAMSSVFGVYSYLSESVTRVINGFITSPINSFGNLFNDKDADSYSVFKEFFNFAAYLASVIAIVIFVVMNAFVYYWMKRPDEYYVIPVVALLFAINIFYLTMREPIMICRDANGLFKDAKNNAYLYAIAKVLLSIILIQWLGFAGVLLATFLCNWIVDFLYNPNLVYKKVFNKSVVKYYLMVLLRIVIAVVLGYISYLIWNHFETFIYTRMINFIIACVVFGAVLVAVITLIYAVSFESFRRLVKRFVGVLKSKRIKNAS